MTDSARPLLSCECVPAVVCPSHRANPTMADVAWVLEGCRDANHYLEEGASACARCIAQALAAVREEAEQRNLNADMACATAAELEIDGLMARVRELEAEKDVFMEHGESIARERDSLRLQCAATEALRLKENAYLLQERDALQARVAVLEAALNTAKERVLRPGA